MIGLGVGAVIALVGYAFVVRQWQRGAASSDFVIGALPFALTLVTIPLSIGVWRTGEVFRELSESAQMGPADIAARFAAWSHEARTAVLLSAVMLTGAAVLQLVATVRAPAPLPDSRAVQDRNWRTWFPSLSVLLFAPVAALSRMAREIPVLILGPMLDPGAVGATTSDPMVGLGAIGDATLVVSSRIHTAVLVGVVTTIALITAGIMNTRALGAPNSLRKGYLAAGVFVAAVVFLAWSAIALTRDLRMFEALTR